MEAVDRQADRMQNGDSNWASCGDSGNSRSWKNAIIPQTEFRRVQGWDQMPYGGVGADGQRRSHRRGCGVVMEEKKGQKLKLGSIW
jgi:hypothetical protein